MPSRRRWSSGWVLTRLHARYSADELKEDLVFRQAKPLIGGRGTPQGPQGKLDEEGAKEASFNNFQGRYIMLHPWTKPLTCKTPSRGRWGGPSGQMSPERPIAARGDAFAPRGKVKLAKLIKTKRAPGLDLSKKNTKTTPKKAL